VIRTGLNYFLMQEMRHERANLENESGQSDDAVVARRDNVKKAKRECSLDATRLSSAPQKPKSNPHELDNDFL